MAGHPLRHPSFAFRRHHHHHHHHHPEPSPTPSPPAPTPGPQPQPQPGPTPAPQPPPGPAPAWPTFTGGVSYAGSSAEAGVAVYYDPTLGQAGLRNAIDLIADADRIVLANESLFGDTAGVVDVLVYAIGGETDGSGGADHSACNYQDGGAIEVCAAFGNPALVSALFEAELSECSMNGRLCGLSTGEALSRWCAISAVPAGTLDGFASGPAWDQAGRPDFVNRTDPTDQNPISTGCGMVFLSWLQRTRGIGLGDIARMMVNLGDMGTLAMVYSSLTADTLSNAWVLFSQALAGLPKGIQSDDPFGHK